jgi:tetratricopeptide (TPR) repeat protein
MGQSGKPDGRSAEAIFTAALALSPSERPAWLAETCGEDQQLRQRVEALLRAHEAPEGFLPETPRNPPTVPSPTSSAADSLTEQPGDTIGRYKLREKIGEGGCGVVYLAEQDKPVRRKVALKIIKLGMDTKQVVARFEAERQALALMDHSNIAKVLDAGATETGRPYFVMELVGGMKITDYCDRNNLGTRERLDLFIQVCRAIQHAHQKGVIHRDIKPSNVLVATQDGVPVPKVIDFGIAKATQGRLTDMTVFTAFEQFIGTPAYMSPEQTQLGSLDVDTRSDIYSLGVLLYELLTGKTPFDSKELLASGLDAMRRTIQEKEPPTPSTRLKQEVAADPSHSSLRVPHSAFDRDLDWIVMKCLEKDRARRYDTANGLARDVERYLKNEPVVASPPGTLYRLQKAVRRNKTAFIAAAAVAIVLVTGVVVSTWQAILAVHAKKQLLAQKQRADEEAAKQEAINRFLNDMLASADPYALSLQDQAKGPNVTMVQVLDAAAQQVAAGSLRDKPAIEAAICQTLGRTYLSLAHAAAAEPLLSKALELNRRIYGELSESATESLDDLCRLRGDQGKLEEAERLARQVLAMERKLHGKEDRHVARALIRLAGVLKDRAVPQEDASLVAAAVATYREALAMQRKLSPPENAELVITLVNLADLLVDFGHNSAEAETLLREALQIQTDVRGERHLYTARVLKGLAEVLDFRANYAEAEPLAQRAVAIERELLGSNIVPRNASFGTLGIVLLREGKFRESEAVFREALALERKAIPGGFGTAWNLKMLAENLTAQKRFAEAEELCREELQIWAENKSAGPGSEEYWGKVDALAKMLQSESKRDEIEALYRDVLDWQRKALGDTHVSVPAMMCRLGDFLVSRNKRGEAEGLYRQADEIVAKLGPGRNRSATLSLRDSLSSRAQFAVAEELYEKLIQFEAQNPESPNLFLGALQQDYGDQLTRANKFPAALDQYLKALPRRRMETDDLNWTLKSSGFALYMSGKPKEAELYVREALVRHRAMHKGDDPDGTTWPTRLLADILWQEGKMLEAEQRYREAWAEYFKFNDPSGADWVVQCLVKILTSQQRLTDAEAVLSQRLAQQRQTFGEHSVRTTRWLLALAHCLKLQSKTDLAADRKREAAELLANAPSEDLLELWPVVIPELIAAGLAEQARAVCSRVQVLTPTNAAWLRDTSWALTQTEEPDARAPDLAAQLARQSLGINPPDYRAQTALGAALYRTGDWQGAVTELEHAGPAYRESDPRPDLFFLAMAQLRLGDDAAARRTYSQAVDWMSQHTPADKELLRLRAEAEALLGVQTSQ